MEDSDQLGVNLAFLGSDTQEFTHPSAACRALDRDGDGNLDDLRLTCQEFKMRFRQQRGLAILEEGKDAQLLRAKVAILHAKQRFVNMSSRTGEGDHVKQQRRRGHGYVMELFTFGAPGTAQSPLYDSYAPGGKIRGLRIFTSSSRFLPGLGTLFKITDPVASVLDFLGYKHPRMEAMEAMQVDSTRERVVNSFLVPPWDRFYWVRGHMLYEKVLRSHAEYLLHRSGTQLASGEEIADYRKHRVHEAYLMSHFALMGYAKAQQVGVDAADWRSRMVARACSQGKSVKDDEVLQLRLPMHEDAQGSSLGCDSHVTLYQEPGALSCVLAFQGSEQPLAWIGEIDVVPQRYCGFGKVHGGVRTKLLRLVGSLDYRQVVWPKLASCSSVTATGHSLGGAMAELFTACANRRLEDSHEDLLDNRLVRFKAGAPRRLASFYSDQVAGAALFQNEGSNLCIDVRGTLATDPHTPVLAYSCEVSGSNFAKHQHWELRHDGFLVNRLSGKCMDGSPWRLHDNKTLVQWECDFDGSGAHQKWDFTEEGFLRSQASGACVSSRLTLQSCPFTSQTWDFESPGYMVNRRSGLCLTRGDHYLWLSACSSSKKEDPDQTWEYTQVGSLRHLASGQCAILEALGTRKLRRYLALGGCEGGERLRLHEPVLLERLGGGFLQTRDRGGCLEVAGKGSPSPGSLVTLSHCETSFVRSSARWRRKGLGGFVRNIGSSESGGHQCLSVFGSAGVWSSYHDNGLRLFLDYCKINTDQKWTFDSGEGLIRNAIGGRKCLALQKKTAMQRVSWAFRIENCRDRSDPSLFLSLKWNYKPSGHLRNRLGLQCLDAPVVNGTSSGEVSLQPCRFQDAAKQLWDMQWRPAAGGRIVNRLSGQCLVAAAAAVASEDQMEPLPPHLAMVNCTGHEAAPSRRQLWKKTSEGFLSNVLLDKCIAGRLASGAADAAAGGLQFELCLQDCPGVTNQQWELLDGGHIRSRWTGECIESESEVQPKSTWRKLTMRPCGAGGAFQRWKRLPALRVE